MASTKYTYSVSGDTLNGVVNPSSLAAEIQASAIVTALDFVGTNGDTLDVWMKDALSNGDETILDGLVAAHAGEASTPSPTIVQTSGPKTDDSRDIVATNRIPAGYTIYFTGVSDNIANGTYANGGDLKMDSSSKTIYYQSLGNYLLVGGRVIWQGADMSDYVDGTLIAPASTGATNVAGDFNKYNIGGPYNMFIPSAPGAGAWSMDINAKLPNTQILKCTPVPATGNNGWFNYNQDTNSLSVSADQKGGYNLYDFDVNLFKFCSKLWGKKQDGSETLLEASDVIGKILFNSWKIKMVLTTAKSDTISVGVVLTTAAKKNL
jgi:hypothetical protein